MSKNLNTLVPFYSSTAEQYKYRDDMQITRKQLRLVCSTLRALPFIIRRSHSAGVVGDLTMTLINANTGATIQSPVVATFLSITTGVTYDYIKYTAAADWAATIDYGTEYYIKITDTFPTPNVDYYSEIFAVVSDVADYLKLEYWDDTEMINQVPAKMHQYFYIDNSFKSPDYIREDEGEKVDGILLKQKSTVQKVLNLYNLITPEFMLDSLINLPMMSDVQVTDLLDDCITPKEVRVKDPDWISDLGGSYAKFDIQLVEWVVIKKGGFREMGCTGTSGKHIENKTGIITATGSPPSGSVVITWDQAFSDNAYEYTIEARDDDGNPIFPSVQAQTVSSMTLGSIRSCSVRVIAVE